MQNILTKLQKLTPFLSLLFFALAIKVVHQEIELYNWDELNNALFSLPEPLFTMTCGLSLFGYFVLSSHDWLGLEYAGEKQPFRRVLLASFLSYAISNNVGYAWLSGGSLRLRMYSNWGMSAASVGKVVLFCAVTYVLGSAALLVGGYLFADPTLLTGNTQQGSMELILLLSTAGLGAWFGLVFFWRKPITLKWFNLALPTPWLAVRQLIAAVADLLAAALVLYVPLSHFVNMPFGDFLTIFIAAQFVGFLSQVPGGIGVFEGSFLLLASGHYPASQIMAALVIYRIAYYFLPLLFSGILLGVYELRRMPAVGAAIGVVQAIIPQLFSALMLFSGAVLLVSGATPARPDRLLFLHYSLPLPLIELSHLVGSMVGVVLLFLSRAVRQKLDSAYFMTIAALVMGMAASLAKGFDYEEALVLGFLLLIFIPARKHFYRKSALLALNFPMRWLAIFALIVGLSVWLGFFSYRHVEYSSQLWWEFSWESEAPRFLRSLVAIAVITIGVLSYRLITRPLPMPLPTDHDAVVNAMPLVQAANETMPHLALTGDKRLLWSESGKSFIMFGTTSRYWISLGDPVGEPSEWEELTWSFREMADRQGAKVAFYQVSDAYLSLYIDLGLTLVKLGEEARVPLATFGIEGKKRQSLRHAYNKFEKDGVVFEIIPAAEVQHIIADLRGISDRWLASKQAREKRFSLGWFDEAYIQSGDVAVAKKDGRILAFANLWQTDNKSELSLDLMRYEPDVVGGIMEYLMLSLMLWGKEQGYRWFNLGMAPLSGLERRMLAPLWHRIGNLIFHFGGDFYNFEGLYRYKEKFMPVWRPRYLATPSSLNTAQVLLGVTGLISGNLKGAFVK